MKPFLMLIGMSLIFQSSLWAEETITIEAESFAKQSLTEKRRWEIQAERTDASGGKSIKVLPDTRTTHDDKLVKGENFSDKPGELAVLEYPFEVTEAGRYFVWARTWSSGSEDNGMHFGLDGAWPESGQRWQTVKKNGWHWDCKQRTADVHTGVPMQLWLDIEKPGQHTLLLSMREDGTEVDQILLAKSPKFRPPGVNYDEKTPAKPKTKEPVPRQSDGNGSVQIRGELQQWHKVTLVLDGPFAAESDESPNPFTDLALNVTFTHESGTPTYIVPGYFAADGNAANSGAESGTKWVAHLAPDKSGTWKYTVSFTKGKHAALDGGGKPWPPFDAQPGSFVIAASDKSGRDFRAHGRLEYVGQHYLQFAGSKQYFLKAGPDSPETLLASKDFDNTESGKPDKAPLKTWQPHVRDWKPGDPTWREGQGKGLIGALNYLADKGVNAFSFLTYNVTGDGDSVWPFVERDDKLHYDCSKLDQWGIVFDHATARGLYLHFKLQENEMDDQRLGPGQKSGDVGAALDGGKLGPERKLYCRELIARFGHALALNWNIGEENTQSSGEIRDMVKYLHQTDPYKHHIVLHTFPPQQDQVYRPLLGDKSLLTGVSLQNPWHTVHQRTLQWRKESAAAGRPWVVANDEQNPAGLGVPPDPGYQGHDGIAKDSKPKGAKAEGYVMSKPYTMHDIRKLTLWGNLLAGGAGVEYYFGYSLPENDLIAQDFRSRDKSWDYCRIALNFFRDEKIPLTEMQSANALVGNSRNDNSKYCFAKPGELYLVYLPEGGETPLDLAEVSGEFRVQWFNPRVGGAPQAAPEVTLSGGRMVKLNAPSADDWLAVIVKK